MGDKGVLAATNSSIVKSFENLMEYTKRKVESSKIDRETRFTIPRNTRDSADILGIGI